MEVHFFGRQRKKPMQSQNACYVIRPSALIDAIWLAMSCRLIAGTVQILGPSK